MEARSRHELATSKSGMTVRGSSNARADHADKLMPRQREEHLHGGGGGKGRESVRKAVTRNTQEGLHLGNRSSTALLARSGDAARRGECAANAANVTNAANAAAPSCTACGLEALKKVYTREKRMHKPHRHRSMGSCSISAVSASAFRAAYALLRSGEGRGHGGEWL